MSSLICLASAGSGKTRQLIEQVHQLLTQSIEPKKILIISYTKNAVEEIGHRLSSNYKHWSNLYTENQLNQINYNTFHGFCWELLIELYNLNAIKLVDKRHQIQDIVPPLDNIPSWQLTTILNNISTEQLFYTYYHWDDYKNNFPFEYVHIQQSFVENIINTINFLKNTLNIWTFSDLIVKTYEILHDKNSLNNLWYIWQKYDGIFIDEAQDFSPMQLDILNKIFNEFIYNNHGNPKKFFFIFGDTKQSIFNFQGANLNHFKSFIDNLETLSRDHKYIINKLNISTTYRLPIHHINFINQLFPPMGLIDFAPHHTHSIIPGIIKYYDPVVNDNNNILVDKIGTFIERLLDEGRKLEDIMIIFRSRDNLVYNLSTWLKNKNYSNGLDIVSSYNSPLINLCRDVYNLINGSNNIQLWIEFTANYFFTWINEQDVIAIINNKLSMEDIHDIWYNYDSINKFLIWIHNLEYTMDIKAYDLLINIVQHEVFSPIFQEENPDIMLNLLESSKNFIGNWQEFLLWIPDNFKTENYGISLETIYGAKGLQKKIIIIVDGHRGPVGKDWQYTYLYNNQNGPLTKFINMDIKNQWLTHKAKEIFEEYKRLMYVATTRSQEELYIFGSYPVETHSLLFYIKDLGLLENQKISI